LKNILEQQEECERVRPFKVEGTEGHVRVRIEKAGGAYRG